MSLDLVLVGCGEHATVVADAVRSTSNGTRLLGYTDLEPNEAAALRAGVTFLGTDRAYLERFVAGPSIRFVLGLAGVSVSPHREKLVRMYEERAAVFAHVIHAAAWVSPSAVIEDGAVILAGAIVNAGARIGRHAIVNSGAIVEHDVDVGAFVSIAPGAVVGGGARLGHGTYIGLGARVRDHVTIGQRTMIGMGAVVVGDVGDDLVCIGVPARPTKGKR